MSLTLINIDDDFHLRDFLAKKAEEQYIDCSMLPLYHTCPFIVARHYIKKRRLLKTECDVFPNEHLVYLFLGRAEYRDYKANHLKRYRPIGFAFNPKAIPKAKRTFPFDTGALYEGKFKMLEDEIIKSFRTHYLLGEDLKNAYALINILYDSPLHYLTQNIRDESKIKYDYVVEPEMDSIKKLHSKDEKYADGRKSTIEVQLDTDIEFTADSVLRIIAPGIVVENYGDLHSLLNELGLPPQIKPDYNPLMERQRSVQDCYTDIIDESINLSQSHAKKTDRAFRNQS